MNAIAPGYTDTGMVAAVPPKVLDGIIAGAPIGRLATPRKSRAASPFWWPMAQGSSPGRPYRPMGGKIWHDLSRMLLAVQGERSEGLLGPWLFSPPKTTNVIDHAPIPAPATDRTLAE